MIRFYHLLKVKPQSKHSQDVIPDFWLTEGQRRNTEERPYIKEMLHNHTTQKSMICEINTYHFPRRLVEFVISIFYSDERFMRAEQIPHWSKGWRIWIFMSMSADKATYIKVLTRQTSVAFSSQISFTSPPWLRQKSVLGVDVAASIYFESCHKC